jgi:hypothetical protein
MQNGGSMLESKILPTILIILPSSVFLLLAHPGAGKAAAEKCNTGPSSSAPQGTHWYYRINSADNRRCWFLSSEDIKVRSHARELISRAPSPSPVPQHGNEPARATAPQTRPAPSARMPPANMPADTASTESWMPQREMAMEFAARWPDRPEFTNVNVSALALMSNSYADTPGVTDAEDELPLRSFDTETGQRQPNPGGETFRLALLLCTGTGLAHSCRGRFRDCSPCRSTVSPRFLARSCRTAGLASAYAF